MRRPAATDPAAAVDPRNLLLRALARRDHSRAELRQKLQGRGIEPQAIEPLLAEFAEHGWVDDERFARSWAAARLRAGDGPRKIAARLQQKGVLPELIDAALAAAAQEAREAREAAGEPSAMDEARDWVREAVALRSRRFGLTPPAGPRERLRQMRFLAGRGFTGAQIAAALAVVAPGDADA